MISRIAISKTSPVSTVIELVTFQLYAGSLRETTARAVKAKHLDLPTQLKVISACYTQTGPIKIVAENIFQKEYFLLKKVNNLRNKHSAPVG